MCAGTPVFIGVPMVRRVGASIGARGSSLRRSTPRWIVLDTDIVLVLNASTMSFFGKRML